MKADVLPFNPKNIDRSRILKNNASIDSRSSTSPNFTANTSNNNQTNNSSSSNNLGTLNDNGHASNNHPPMINPVSSSQPIVSSFTSSHEAIDALDRILEETKSNDSSGIEDDDNEEYFPPKSSFASSMAVSSTKQQKSQPKKPLAMKRYQSISTQPNKKRKTLASKIIGFDSSDRDGNADDCIDIIIKNELFV
jgi:hypothetical protein